MSIERFPPDVFFVLRVVQMLRGLAGGMQVSDFSVVEQWAPYARAAVAAGPHDRSDGPCVTAPSDEWERAVGAGAASVAQIVEDDAREEQEQDHGDGDGDGFVTARAVQGLGLVPLDDGGDGGGDEGRGRGGAALG